MQLGSTANSPHHPGRDLIGDAALAFESAALALVKRPDHPSPWPTPSAVDTAIGHALDGLDAMHKLLPRTQERLAAASEAAAQGFKLLFDVEPLVDERNPTEATRAEIQRDIESAIDAFTFAQGALSWL